MASMKARILSSGRRRHIGGRRPFVRRRWSAERAGRVRAVDNDVDLQAVARDRAPEGRRTVHRADRHQREGRGRHARRRLQEQDPERPPRRATCPDVLERGLGMPVGLRWRPPRRPSAGARERLPAEAAGSRQSGRTRAFRPDDVGGVRLAVGTSGGRAVLSCLQRLCLAALWRAAISTFASSTGADIAGGSGIIGPRLAGPRGSWSARFVSCRKS